MSSNQNKTALSNGSSPPKKQKKKKEEPQLVSHKERRLNQKRLGIAFIAVLFLIFLKSWFQSNFHQNGNMDIVRSWTIPISEISGITAIPKSTSNQSINVSIIGDTNAEIWQGTLGISLQQDRGLDPFFSGQIIDAAPIILARNDLCSHDIESLACRNITKDLTSQWEALAYFPSTQSILALQEHANIIYGFKNPTLEIEHILSFNFEPFLSQFPQSKPFKSKLAAKNSLGEGLAVLDNNHFVIAKEKMPASLILFEKPSYTPLKNERVQVKIEDLKPLAASFLPKPYHRCDISDLAKKANSNDLYILSQTCRSIFKIQNYTAAVRTGLDSLNNGAPEIPLSITDAWVLPSKIKTPEAFIHVKNTVFIVGSDAENKKAENLFLINAKHERKSSKK